MEDSRKEDGTAGEGSEYLTEQLRFGDNLS
jgi:hypothetical protein